MELVGASPLIAGLTRNLPTKNHGDRATSAPCPISFQSSPRGLALPEGVPVPAHDKSPTARNLTNLYKSYKSILIYLVSFVRFLPRRGTPVFYRRNEIVAADCGSSPQWGDWAQFSIFHFSFSIINLLQHRDTEWQRIIFIFSVPLCWNRLIIGFFTLHSSLFT